MKKIKVVSPLIKRVEEELKNGNREALNKFWQDIEKKGAPIIEEIEGDKENCLLTVIWKDEENLDTVAVMGEIFGVDMDPDIEDTHLERLLDTNLLYRTYKVKNHYRGYYLFAINPEYGADWDDIDFRIDPLNPVIYTYPEDEERPGETGMIRQVESFIQLPQDKIKNQWISEREDIEKGNVDMFKFESKILNNKRRIWVYTPAGYDAEKEAYGTVIFTDGWEYVNVVETPKILDNLIAEGKIPPMCAIFVDTHKDRDTELTCHQPFVDFLTEELLPSIQESYNISKNAEKNIIAGFSYGGVTSAFIALKHSDIFGKAICQSGSFWWKPEEIDENETEWFINKFKNNEKLPVDFYLTMGVYEKAWDFHYEACRNFEKVLADKGNNVTYNEFVGGHIYTECQITLPEALITLVGK